MISSMLPLLVRPFRFGGSARLAVAGCCGTGKLARRVSLSSRLVSAPFQGGKKLALKRLCEKSTFDVIRGFCGAPKTLDLVEHLPQRVFDAEQLARRRHGGVVGDFDVCSAAHFSSPSLMASPCAAPAELSFTLTGTPVHLGEKDIDDIFLPVLLRLPVKTVAAMTGLSDRGVVKLRNREAQPSLVTALKLALGDPDTMARLDRRLRGGAAVLDQQIAATDLEIAKLQAKRKELLNASHHGRRDERNTSVAGGKVQPGGGGSEHLGGLVARLGGI